MIVALVLVPLLAVRPDSVPRAPRDPREVQPERPTVSTPASTVAPGYAEVESGAERDRYAPHALGTVVPTVLKLGVAPRVQASLFAPLSSTPDARFGVGDLAMGVKWRVLEDAPLLQDVAVLPQVKFNTGGARGTGTTDVSLLLIDSRAVGPASLDLNAGYTWRSGDGRNAPRTASLLAAAVGVPVLGNFGWTAECFAYPGTSGPAGERPIVGLITGPTFKVTTTLALDTGIIAPISGPQPHALYAGLVTNLGRFVPRAPR